MLFLGGGGEIVNNNKEIVIGNHVWIGCRSVILKGVSISDDCVIAANTTVTKSFKDSAIMIGGVNKILKSNIVWNARDISGYNGFN